jgi:hypothetical protein
MKAIAMLATLLSFGAAAVAQEADRAHGSSTEVNRPGDTKSQAGKAVAEVETVPTTTKITGRIVDPAGDPLEGMQIVAAVLPGPPKRAPKPGRRMEWYLSGEPAPIAVSDAEGRFTIDGADPRATVLVQFEGDELLAPREWKPKGSIGTTITLAPAKKEREGEIGYVPRRISEKETTVDGQKVREVTINWAPTRVNVRWGRADSLERWKSARTLAEANDPLWKQGLEQFDETTWVVQPGEYMRTEATERINLGPALKASTSFGQGLRADSEKEIFVFHGVWPEAD